MKQLLLNNKSNNFQTVPKIPKPQSMPKTQVYLGLGGSYNLENGGYSNANFYMHPTISHQFDKGWGLSVSPGTFVHNSEKYPGGNFRLTGFLPEHSVTVSKSFQGGGQFESILNRVYKSNANFAKRLRDPNRKSIPDWMTDSIATHKMSVGTDENGQPYIYPEVQEINGKLIDFTRSPYNRDAGMISAEEHGDTIHVPTIKDGVDFTKEYKKYFPNFQAGGRVGKTQTAARGPIKYNIPSTFSPGKTKEWIKYWYSNRSPQIQKNIKEARSTQAQWNKQMNTINTYKWYQSPKYLPQKIKSKASKNDFDDRRINGMTLPDYKTIYFNNPTYPGSSIQVHEGTHSQEPKIQKAIIPRHIKLKSGQYKDSYYDDPDEINSRVMEFRYINKLNPKRRYSIEEIRKMKDEGDGGTSWPGGKRPLDILNRYDDSTLLYLINGLAYNNNYKDQDIQYTKRGGTLKFQTGGTIPVGKAAKTAFKIFKGDHLKLMKQRLKNGGFERLAKTAKEDEAIKPSPGGMGEYKQNLLTKSQDWLLAQEPMKVSSKELEEYKRKHGLPKPVTSPKSGASSQFGKYYTDLYTDAPEKLKAIPNDKHQIAAHEYSHFVYKPSTTAPGFNYDKFPTAGQYFHGKNGSSELAARGSQLKNYFGLNKGSDDITPEMLTYAKEHYVKDTGIDNNMTSMFESVEDSNKFSNWISKNAPLIPLELTMKSIMLRNQPDPLSAKKGSKIAKHSWSADFGHTVDGNPNLDNMKGDYVTKKKRRKAQYGTKLNYLKSLYY